MHVAETTTLPALPLAGDGACELVLLVSCSRLIAPNEYGALLCEAARVLAPGGALALIEPDAAGWALGGEFDPLSVALAWLKTETPSATLYPRRTLPIITGDAGLTVGAIEVLCAPEASALKHVLLPALDAYGATLPATPTSEALVCAMRADTIDRANRRALHAVLPHVCAIARKPKAVTAPAPAGAVLGAATLDALSEGVARRNYLASSWSALEEKLGQPPNGQR